MPPQNTSLRRLLSLDQPPTSPRTPIQSKRAPIERLPAFILHDIGRHSDLRDVLHLSLCSHRLSRVLAPVLYASVELTTNRNCKNALIALAKRPDLMQHVRRLVVRPNCVEWTDEGEEMDEGLVATLISRMAVSLRALEVFEWDGMEMAGSVLWAALKLSCRNLKRIGTSIGEDPLDPSSPLWEFEDLRQFSLRVKCHSLDWISGGLAKPEKLPRRFWEMILERSPRLEDLTISSPAPSPRTFDIRHITCGRWSRLHALTLGDHVLISSDQNNYNTKDHKALMAFFLHHPGLRTLRLEHTPGSAYFPAGFDFETSHALPNVEEFAGPIAWVRTLPVQQRLRRLRVVGMHHSYHGYGIADSNVARTCRVLSGLRWLEELSVWIDLSVGGGAATASGVGANGRRASFSGRKETSASEDVNMEVVNKFLVSRPGLKHLEVSCFSRPTFSIKDFSATIRRSAPTLESFTLTKVHKSGDDEERELTRLAAANIATDNPGLRKFTLRTTVDPWYSPGFGFHAGQSAGMGGANAGGRLKQLGVYEVLESFTVVPSTLEQSNSDGRGFEGEEFGVLDRTEPSHIAMPTTTTALLVREWGQKTKSATSRLIMDTLGSKSQTSRCYVFPLNLSDPLSSSSSMPGYDSDTNTSPPSSASHTAPRLRLASLSPPTSPTNTTHFPPSSWQKNTSILNKKHSHSRSLSGGGTSGSSPFSLLTRTRSRSNSPSPCHPANVGWRPRRASCSSGESFGGGWEGYGSAHGHGSARAGGGGGGVPSNRSRSNRSSFSSTFEAAGSASGCVTLGSSSGCGGGGQAQPTVYRRVQIQTQAQPFALQDPNEQPIFDPQQAFPHGRHPPPQQGGQVTWAESVQENSSLRRSGSASTTGNSGASSSSDSQSTPPPPPPPLSEKRSRTKSLRLSGLRWGIGKGRGKWKEEIIEREVVIEEGYILV